MKKETRKLIEREIKQIKKVPVSMYDLYSNSMAFSRRTFSRGMFEFEQEGLIVLEKKSLGRGKGVKTFIIQKK